MEQVLLTGITGLVGGAVAVEALTANSKLKIVALARGGSGITSRDKVAATIRSQCVFDGKSPATANELLARITLFDADLRQIDPVALSKELPTVDTIFHCAADVNLGKDLDGSVYRGNLAGTTNMLDLAQLVGRPPFHMVSTAYVAGKHTGLSLEDHLIDDIDFNNAYERSKHEAERLVRESGLNFSIYRPSIVVGRLTDGRIRRPLAFYRILEFIGRLKEKRAIKSGLKISSHVELPFRLEARLSDKIYFVPIDYVQKTIAALFTLPAEGKAYHITGRSPISTKRIEKTLAEVLNVSGLVVMENVNDKKSEERLVNRLLGDLMPYFSSEITFDTSNVEAALGSESLDWVLDDICLAAMIREYYRGNSPELLPETSSIKTT